MSILRRLARSKRLARRRAMQRIGLGSAHVSLAGDGVPPSRTFLSPCPYLRSTFSEKTVSARLRNQHAGSERYPDKLERTKLSNFAYKLTPTPRNGHVL